MPDPHGPSPRRPAGIEAVLFDMDGTLIDSEPLTDDVVQAVLDDYGLPPPSFPLCAFHGKTWNRVEAELAQEYPALKGEALVSRMESDFDARMRTRMPLAVPGAVEAFRAAGAAFVVGIVSSSPRRTVQFVVGKLGLSGIGAIVVGGDDVRHSKPHPECYLKAAGHARVRPSSCLVFEDSEAGLEAARAAGMPAFAVLGNRDPAMIESLSRRAAFVLRDFEALPGDFFAAETAS